ncbi:MAG: nitroreductase family deazaflavin-dependent oxidoreductase [Proteobacteria bacterium]|nr:nitroreductase family deazaflavin-dependent oxidoreductase [Pseudomonadota bacterium]
MKLPEPFFLIINPIMGALLKSPLHGLLSDSLMLITFTGRKSQRQFTTPVRYLPVDDSIQCFTSPKTQWWKNMRGGALVTLRLKNEDRSYQAVVIENDPDQIKKLLIHYLDVFPQDAAYHDIHLNQDKSLNSEDLERASKHSIAVVATPLK